jgi:hypothetical protein
MQIRCDLIDDPVSIRVLAVVRPKQIEIAIKAIEELNRRENAIDNQWRMKIERAEYESNLAQRRYEEVDPSNRLVAATLERRWDDALIKVGEIKKEFSQHQSKKRIAVTEKQKRELISLANDLPRLWKTATTKAKDRKRILRLLIKDVTVEKLPIPKQVVLHLRWQGGACEDIPIEIPPNRPDQIRYPSEIVNKVKTLAMNLTDEQIASVFNQDGIKSAKGRPFTFSIIRWIRYKHRISRSTLKRPEELTVKEMAREFAVSPNVVYYWIERNLITARRLNQGSPYWITMDDQKEKELFEWISNSNRINGQITQHS